MKQNLFRLEMQIPEGESYTGLENMPAKNGKLNEFLKNNFEFPSNNISEITGFISQDKALKNIIYDFPKIIEKELSYEHLSLDFMKETEPSEKILEIIIYSSNLDEELQLQKEDVISDGIIDNYPQAKNEFIILVES